MLTHEQCSRFLAATISNIHTGLLQYSFIVTVKSIILFHAIIIQMKLTSFLSQRITSSFFIALAYPGFDAGSQSKAYLAVRRSLPVAKWPKLTLNRVLVSD